MKSYTDLKQSKTLEKILPIESADLYYDISFDNEYHINMPTNGYFGNKRFFIQFPEAVPCWSLAALLSIIPNYKLSSEHNYHTCTAETSFGKETVAWFDSPVDACVELIIKLKENKVL